MDCKFVRTVCPYCAVGCNMVLEVLDNEIVDTLPAKTDVTDKGGLCIKGWTVHEFVQHPERLTYPFIRENRREKTADWEEALDYSAKEIQRIRDTYGPESIAFVGSARCTNEEAFIFQKLCRSLFGHNHVDHCARL